MTITSVEELCNDYYYTQRLPTRESLRKDVKDYLNNLFKEYTLQQSIAFVKLAILDHGDVMDEEIELVRK